MKTGRRQKRVAGDVVRIDLGDGFACYGRVTGDAGLAVYDLRSSEAVALSEIMSRPILFHISVMDNAITSGHWAVVGHAPLEDALSNPPPRFIRDPIRKDTFRIYEDGKMRPATRDECVGLEAAAVWGARHVEERLRDHYAGVKNRSTEHLKLDE